jgi:hypothetical protein
MGGASIAGDWVSSHELRGRHGGKRPMANKEAVTTSGHFQSDIHVLPRGIRMFWFGVGWDLAQEWAPANQDGFLEGCIAIERCI